MTWARTRENIVEGGTRVLLPGILDTRVVLSLLLLVGVLLVGAVGAWTHESGRGLNSWAGFMWVMD